MATATKISAQPRTKTGSRDCNRMRIEGIVPANVYGHGEDPVGIAISAEAARPLVMSGHKLVDLEVEGKTQQALLREVQWDTFGKHLLHLDFLRIDATQRVMVDVPIHLKGTAPGVVAGGMLEQPLHSLHIECLAVEVPDEVIVKIGSLEMGQSIHVRDLTDLPPSVIIKNSTDAVVVHVVHAKAEDESGAPVPGSVEPEVIGKKKEDGTAEA